MRHFKFKSLTMRIWTTFTAIILVIIFSISILYMVAFRKITENNKIADLKVFHDNLVDTLTNNNNFEGLNRARQYKNLIGSNYFILEKASDGSTKIVDVNKNRNSPPPEMKDDPHFPMGGNDFQLEKWMASFIKTDNISDKQFIEQRNNMKFLFIVSSVKYGESGKSYLISYLPNREDNTFLYIALVIGLVFIGIGFLTAKLVANYLSKPLKMLEDYTVRIAHKDWKEPIKIKNEDEIGRLADAMNRMQNELKHADEEEKMFLQSISHDLKTPVMVIMSHAEAIMDGVYIESEEKTAEIIRDEAISLEKKIKQMLYLNTLNYVLDNSSEYTNINLRELLLHIINRFEVINSKIEWRLELQDILINANVDKIQVAIENILDNGLRYAEQEIGVILKKEGSYAVLELYNDGPNIDKIHVDHIFDNLYKDKTGNFGLGLAISKKIIDFYKGEIWVENRDKGVSFIIKLPI